MDMKNFFRKVGTGAVIGITIGVIGAFSFIGITRTIDRFFPSKNVAKETETDGTGETKNENEVKSSADEEKALPDKDKPKSDKKDVDLQLTTVSLGDKKGFGDRSTGLNVVDLAKNNLPSVVSITNTSVAQVRDMWGRGVREYENVSCGSGIIIGQTDEEILIATNCHVVSGAKSITAGFADDEIVEASLKGSDADIDLAVIGVKISDMKNETLKTLKVAAIGDSDALQVGEQVVAIGNAIGYGQSVTTGIVSALNRDIPDDGLDTAYIQTDAAINPGNSGGALFNMAGELVGINSAKIASTYVEGIGYAIPMNAAKPIIESLMNRKTREKVDENKAGYIGISGVSVDGSISRDYGIPEGVYLQNVVEGGPADKAGLTKGDVIRKFDGVTVSSINDIRNNLDYYEEGEEVDLVIYRFDGGEYKEKTVSITLGTRKGTDLDPDKVKDESSMKEGESDSEDGDKESDKSNGKGSGQDFDDFYDSLPDELQELFRGFGR